MDVLLCVFHLQEEHLRDHQIGDMVVNGGADKNNPVLEQPRVDVVAALAAPGLFNHHRYQHSRKKVEDFVFEMWDGMRRNP